MMLEVSVCLGYFIYVITGVGYWKWRFDSSPQL